MCSQGGTIINMPVNVDVFLNLAGNGSAISNLNASNLTFGVVDSSLIYGNTLSNLNFSNVTGLLPNTISNLNASNLSFGVVDSSLIYGNTLSNLNFSNVTGLLPNTISNLNASNLAFGVVNSTLIYGNTLSNLQFSNVTGLLPNTISNLNASNLAFGVVPSSLIYGNTLSNINSSNITQPFTNLVVSNSLTTTNVNSTGQVGIGTTGFGQGTLSVYTAGNGGIAASFYDKAGQNMFIVPRNNGDGYNFPFSKGGDVLFNMTYCPFSFGIQNSPNLGIGLRAGHQSGADGGSVTLYANTKVMAVTNTGVGIGITNPAAPLVLYNPVSSGGIIKLVGNSSVSGTPFTNWIGLSDGAPGADNNDRARIGFTLPYGGNGEIYFSTANPPVERMRIFANGTIGIGTTVSQSANLYVTGNIYASNALQTPNLIATTANIITLNVTGTATASFFVGGGNTLSNIQSSNITQPFANLVVSNTLTTTNIIAAGFTSNSTNTNFNYDTLTVPFISSTTLNVSSTSNIVGSLTVAGTVICPNPFTFKNRLINGSMNIWQRGTSGTATAASAYTTADRWCGALGTTNLTLTQSSTVPTGTGFQNSLQVATTTSTASTPLIEQRIEYVNVTDLISGTYVALSFWASQTSGTLMPLTVGLYYATAVNNFSTQTLAVASTQSTATLTASLVYYSVSFLLNTSLGATQGLCLRFTSGATASACTFLITGVQLEKGPLASPFEYRPYQTELALAQRYYYQLTSPTAAAIGASSVFAVFGTATGITTTAFWLPLSLPVPMRSNAYTLSNSAVSNFALIPTGSTTITSVAFQTDSFTPVSATLNFVGTNITAGSSYLLRTNGLTGSTTAFIGVSAEL